MLHVATCIWDANERTNPLSGKYTDVWVERLYRGFARNLTVPFKFVCFVDRLRNFAEPIHQERLSTKRPDYSNFTEPYRLNEPMILVGLDTVIVGNIDHFAAYCMKGEKIALLRDPKSVRLKEQGYPNQSINGVALVPAGWRKVYDEWTGENDMRHLRRYPWECINDRWPGEALSYKLDVRWRGDVLLPSAKIVYWHGQPKMDTLTHIPWLQRAWA